MLIREALVMIPLIAAQVGICLVFRKRIVTVIAVAAVLGGLAGNLWMLGVTSQAVSAVSGWAFVWLMSCLPAYVVYLLCKRLGAWDRAKNVSPARRNLLKAAVATPFAVMGYGVAIGRREFYVREVSLPVPGLHPDLEGLRILHLSDVHMGEFLSERDFARVIDMANGLRPNLAIMTGDLISKPGDPMEACVQQLARVRSDAGMYGCMGNHEMYAEIEAKVKAEGARHGIAFLRHESRQLRFGNAVMNIGGVDYQKAASRKDYLKGTEKLLANGALNVMLSHNPDVFPISAKQGWDLTLSGHTHGGQITCEIVEQYANVARFITPYVAGEYHLGNAGCYVTRGIGTVGLPARIGVPPEITLLRLRKA
jgi:predicted MPP superfamily phosphohydrolase